MAENKGRDNKDNKEMTDDDENFITLEFDDGIAVECEILGVFEVEGKEYIALLPDDGTEDVYLYGYREVNEDEFEILDIEDDKEFEKVAAEFEKISMEEIVNLDDE